MESALNSSTHWEHLKRLTFVIDSEPPIPIDLPTGDPLGRTATPKQVASSTLSEMRRLVHELELIAPRHTSTKLNLSVSSEISVLNREDCHDQISAVFGDDSFADGTLAREINEGRLQKLIRRAYSMTLLVDGWPKEFVVTDSGRVQVGMVVRSLSSSIEGRTTGGRRRCPAHGCPGWLIGVLWETGQQLHICSEGWHYDSNVREIRVVGGGEISARFVSPPPLGTPPLPKSEWPPRSELQTHSAWRVEPPSQAT